MSTTASHPDNAHLPAPQQAEVERRVELWRRAVAHAAATGQERGGRSEVAGWARPGARFSLNLVPSSSASSEEEEELEFGGVAGEEAEVEEELEEEKEAGLAKEEEETALSGEEEEEVVAA